MKSFLEFLLSTSKSQRKMLITNLSYQQLKLIVEILYNIAMENIPLRKEDKRKLTQYKSSIRKVLSTRITRRQRLVRLIKLNEILPIVIRNYLQWQES